MRELPDTTLGNIMAGVEAQNMVVDSEPEIQHNMGKEPRASTSEREN